MFGATTGRHKIAGNKIAGMKTGYFGILYT